MCRKPGGLVGGEEALQQARRQEQRISMGRPQEHRFPGMLSEWLVPIGLLLGALVGGACAATLTLLVLQQTSGGGGSYAALTERFLVIAAATALGMAPGAMLGALTGAVLRNALGGRDRERK
jgi:uncharacterized membrane protein YfcA